MSHVVTPTRTGGSRPPIPPPITTAFSPEGGDEFDGHLNLIASDVNRILRLASECRPEQDEQVLTLLWQRRRLVVSELEFERLLTTEPPPPILAYMQEFMFDESETIMMYIRLLDALDSAILAVSRRMVK